MLHSRALTERGCGCLLLQQKQGSDLRNFVDMAIIIGSVLVFLGLVSGGTYYIWHRMRRVEKRKADSEAMKEQDALRRKFTGGQYLGRYGGQVKALQQARDAAAAARAGASRSSAVVSPSNLDLIAEGDDSVMVMTLDGDDGSVLQRDSKAQPYDDLGADAGLEAVRRVTGGAAGHGARAAGTAAGSARTAGNGSGGSRSSSIAGRFGVGGGGGGAGGKRASGGFLALDNVFAAATAPRADDDGTGGASDGGGVSPPDVPGGSKLRTVAVSDDSGSAPPTNRSSGSRGGPPSRGGSGTESMSGPLLASVVGSGTPGRTTADVTVTSNPSSENLKGVVVNPLSSGRSRLGGAASGMTTTTTTAVSLSPSAPPMPTSPASGGGGAGGVVPPLQLSPLPAAATASGGGSSTGPGAKPAFAKVGPVPAAATLSTLSRGTPGSAGVLPGVVDVADGDDFVTGDSAMGRAVLSGDAGYRSASDSDDPGFGSVASGSPVRAAAPYKFTRPWRVGFNPAATSSPTATGSAASGGGRSAVGSGGVVDPATAAAVRERKRRAVEKAKQNAAVMAAADVPVNGGGLFKNGAGPSLRSPGGSSSPLVGRRR